ncbi:hypothetical protein BG004_005261 [Podila humilis]|nr:hypothetical protein BG004_005261 [Podila humilis]
MSSQDYRVSTIVVLCKDCGNDVGAYPGRHKCSPADHPPMPSLPSIPLKYQQDAYSQSSTISSFSTSRSNNGHKGPSHLDSHYANSYEDASMPPASATTSATPTAGPGTTLWNRLLAAKEVINATISGEERWPESDDSDHEGESHVYRVLRERVDKKDEAEMAAKIAALEMTPYDHPASSTSKSSGRNQYLRDTTRKEVSSPSIISSTSSGEDHYGRSLRSRNDTNGYQATESDQAWSTSPNGRYYGGQGVKDAAGHNSRNRNTSDVSRDDALSRLEGKSDGGKLNAQISHLGSTSPRVRANSPHVGHREDAGTQRNYNQEQQLSPSLAIDYQSSSSSSQRSISPSNRICDSSSPSNRPAPGFPQQPQQQQSSSLRSDPYSSRGQQYESHRHAPPTNNLRAYGQRQQYQQTYQHQNQQLAYQGNYF